MLYNLEKQKVNTPVDCLTCRCYDKKHKTCNGMGKICNVIDDISNTVIDSVTGLPLPVKKEEV